MKLPVTLFLLFAFFSKAPAQNLFANPGFEDINICTEYHMPCSSVAWFPIHPVANPPVNGVAVPEPLLGTNLLLVPVANVNFPDSLPYVYTMFLCPLVKGEKYKLSFYINTLGRKFYHIDFSFTRKEPSSAHFDIENIKPSIILNETALVAEIRFGWRYAEIEYTATGGEKFCTIGNMSERMSYGSKSKSNKAGTVYYFLDEIKMAAASGIVCSEYEDNRKILYAQHTRHTEHDVVDKEGEKPPKPIFRSDTLIIPNALFETNSAIPKKGFIRVTDSLIALIPQKGPAKIDICGYTDSRGKPADNQILSERRATAVLEYFLQKMPALKESIFAAGKGADFPKADNNTERGRAINRRVEIVLTYFVPGE